MSKRSQFFLLPISEDKPPGAFTVLILQILAIYAPFAWLLIREGPWDANRWNWIKCWPLLPGLVVRSLGILDGMAPQISYYAMGALTLLVLIVLYKLGRNSRTSLVVSLILGAGFAGWNAWLAYQAYLPA